MKVFYLFYLIHFSISSCTYFVNFNGTSFYFSFLLYLDQTLCINSTKDDWSLLVNEGVQNFNFTTYYRDINGMNKILHNSTDFLGIHVFGSNSSIEIKTRERSYLSFAIVSFDRNCDVRIISNLFYDNITSNDWPNPESPSKKLCYFNGLHYKNHFIRKTKSSSSTIFHNSDGSNFPWLSAEYETTTFHPPILELSYDKKIQISVITKDFSKMNHGRSILIMNSTNNRTTVFNGVPYDPSICFFYDFSNETLMISAISIFLNFTFTIFPLMIIAFIITYCCCCSCCRYYHPQCLYRFGLKPSDQTGDQRNPYTADNGGSNSSLNIQQPVYYVYQQQITEPPDISSSRENTDDQFERPLMSVTTNPPPGVYEPVRVTAPIVPVTIVSDDSI